MRAAAERVSRGGGRSRICTLQWTCGHTKTIPSTAARGALARFAPRPVILGNLANQPGGFSTPSRPSLVAESATKLLVWAVKDGVQMAEQTVTTDIAGYLVVLHSVQVLYVKSP